MLTPQSEPGGRSAFGIARISAGTARGSPIARRVNASDRSVGIPIRAVELGDQLGHGVLADRRELADRPGPLLVAGRTRDKSRKK